MRELNHGEDGSYVEPAEGAGAYRGPITTENGSANHPIKVLSSKGPGGSESSRGRYFQWSKVVRRATKVTASCPLLHQRL